jgi:hypothetical protein
LQLRVFAVALLAAGLAHSLAHAASPAPLSLTQLTRKAGFIFAARVLRVEHPTHRPGTVPVVHITLRVERAMRGVQRGQTFTFTQWAGAGDSGPQYRPGQRLLLFLYPRSSAGLTSVIGGRLGQFDLDPAGNIVLRADQQRILFPTVQEPADAAAARPRSPAKLAYRDFTGRVRRAASDER